MGEQITPDHIFGEQFGICNRWPVRAELWVASGVDPHEHDFMEFNIVSGGRGIHRSATGDREVGRGDLFFLKPGAWHSYVNCDRLHVYNCVFQPTLLENELGWLRYESALAYVLFTAPLMDQFRGIWHATAPGDLIDQCVNRLAALPELVRNQPRKPDSGSRARIIAEFLSFLCVLEDHIDSLLEETGARHSQPHPIVHQVVSLFNSDLTREWSLEDLAGVVLCDRAYLSRLCRRYAGLPPMALLARMRADRAAYLLARTSLPVGKVGAAVGWPQPDHLAKRFRDHFHQSASSYRMKMSRGS
jgi:AraC family L-rhamnose operon transcriptional activator RhaR